MPPLRLPTLIAAGCAGLMLISLSGCAGDSDGKKGALPGAADAKNYTGPKPKKEDLPLLPPEAGKMDDDAPDELTPTKSGLYYRILRKSKGRRPGPGDTVLVHYRGTLDNGNVFDTSYDRGDPQKLDLNRVIAGWTEGIQLVSEGGMIELEVKASLGYGAQPVPANPGYSPIPANSRLHFIIELVKIEDRS